MKRKVGKKPVVEERRTVTLTFEADESTLERLAALMLFSSYAPPLKQAPEIEYVDPVEFEEVESVRQELREFLHRKAQAQGLDLAKRWMQEQGDGCEGIAKANDNQLALMRHAMQRGM